MRGVHPYLSLVKPPARIIMHTYTFTVNLKSAKKRLDLFLSEQALPLTRSRIKKLIDTHQVTLNKTLVKAARRVNEGDVVEVQVPEPQEPEVEAQDIPLDILYEDEWIIVVNKPAGMVVHPAAGNYSGTLVNALLMHCSFLRGVGGVMRPGVVHRLDKGTSGVMVVAKNDRAQQVLSQQFKNHSVKKIYRALVYGQMREDEGTIETEIGRHCKDRKKMSIHTRRGRSALTQWKVLRRYGEISLLEISIHTGRTHQIRVHLSSLHHPVVGDSLYGSRKMVSQIRNKVIREKLGSLSRPFLHASLLGFHHPHDSQYREFNAPLPQELSETLTVLEGETCS